MTTRDRGTSHRHAWIALGALMALGACRPAESPKRTVSLRIQGSPPEAMVTIDDEVVGTLDVVEARGVALPPGQHRITVEAPGYFPHDRIVVAKDRKILLKIQLVPVPD